MQSSHNVHEKFATIECNFPRLVITYSSKAVQISDGVYDLCATRLFLVPYIIYSLLYVFVCSKPQGSVKSPKFFNSCHEQLADTGKPAQMDPYFANLTGYWALFHPLS